MTFAPNYAEAGVLDVLPGVIGLPQTTEAIKLLTDIGSPTTGRMLVYDGLDLSFTTIEVAKDADCPCCSKSAGDIVLKETVVVCAVSVGRSIDAAALKARRALIPARRCERLASRNVASSCASRAEADRQASS